MPLQLSLILPYVLFVSGAGLLGGLAASFWSPKARTRSAIQHFAAGAVLAAVASSVTKRKNQMPVGLAAAAVVDTLLVLGALVARFLLRDASEATVAVVLAFGAAALIYLIAEELLVEVIQAEESIFSTAMLLAGFLVLIALKLFNQDVPS